MKTMTVSQIREKFRAAEKAGKNFMYECMYGGIPHVRSSVLGYCPIIKPEVALAMEHDNPETFYPIVDNHNEDFSNHYDFYEDCSGEESAFFAVRLVGGRK